MSQIVFPGNRSGMARSARDTVARCLTLQAEVRKKVTAVRTMLPCAVGRRAWRPTLFAERPARSRSRAGAKTVRALVSDSPTCRINCRVSLQVLRAIAALTFRRRYGLCTDRPGAAERPAAYLSSSAGRRRLASTLMLAKAAWRRPAAARIMRSPSTRSPARASQGTLAVPEPDAGGARARTRRCTAVDAEHAERQRAARGGHRVDEVESTSGAPSSPSRRPPPPPPREVAAAMLSAQHQPRPRAPSPSPPPHSMPARHAQERAAEQQLHDHAARRWCAG